MSARRPSRPAGPVAFGLLVVALCLAPHADAATPPVEASASAIQSGYWLGLNQQFYNSGWHDDVNTVSALAGHPLYDPGPFAVSTSLHTQHGTYAGAARAIAQWIDGINGTALASAELQGVTRDVLQVVSPTLPIGTPVSLEYRLALHSTGVPGLSSTLTLGAGAFIRLDVGGADPSRSTTQWLHDGVQVGDSIVVESGFRLRANAEARSPGSDYPIFQDASGSALGGFSIRVACLACPALPAVSLLSADGALDLTSGPLDSRVSLVALSGHDYSQLVPEPSTWALWLAGLCGLVAVAGRRRHLPVALWLGR